MALVSRHYVLLVRGLRFHCPDEAREHSKKVPGALSSPTIKCLTLPPPLCFRLLFYCSLSPRPHVFWLWIRWAMSVITSTPAHLTPTSHGWSAEKASLKRQLVLLREVWFKTGNPAVKTPFKGNTCLPQACFLSIRLAWNFSWNVELVYDQEPRL
jgi:hypothetical protein